MPFDFDVAVSAPFGMQPGLRRIAPGAEQPTPSITPAAVFTIHVEVAPLRAALADGARRALVHDALASMGDAVLEYRGLAAVRDRLLRWLSGHGG